MKKVDMEQQFATVPSLPEDFEEVCYRMFSPVRIYYKREGKLANCICGNCGKHFIKGSIKREVQPEDYLPPKKGEMGTCPHCGNQGPWEWKRVTHIFYESYNMLILQETTDHDLVARTFLISQDYSQRGATRKCIEIRRIFFRKGDTYKFYNGYCYWKNRCERTWDTSSGGEGYQEDAIYNGWEESIKYSNFKYFFDICQYAFGTGEIQRSWLMLNALEACANNPAMEMFFKTGMCKLVDFMIRSKGITKYINRRAKTPLKQLRLKDKAMLNRLIREKGDTDYLKVLQLETKTGEHYTEKQEKFVLEVYKAWKGEEELKKLLTYMSLEKLMNRVERYKKEDTHSLYQVIDRYCDYLEMRKELGYDMENEVFLFPKSLKEKHQEMVDEKNKRADELYIAKMKSKFGEIEKRFKKLDKKYHYEKDGLEIRPAKDAEEIVLEGRKQHHCVGREIYLERHNQGKSFILLLRKTEKPNVPYYTIEIREDRILQWYGKFDKKPDEEKIEKWLEEYVRHLKKKEKKIA